MTHRAPKKPMIAKRRYWEVQIDGFPKHIVIADCIDQIPSILNDMDDALFHEDKDNITGVKLLGFVHIPVDLL